MKFSLTGNFFKKTLAFASLATMVAACGGTETLEVGSQVKVTNGQVIDGAEYPSVVLLYDNEVGSICTGTFISPTEVLTAAHCTMGGEVDSLGNVAQTLYIIELEQAVEGEQPTANIVGVSEEVVRNIEWDRNGGNVNRYDLAVITFPEGVAKDVSEIASIPAARGDEFTIVGFGLNGRDQTSAGTKRKGDNQISSISGGFIRFTGKNETTDASGTDVSAGSGDSGGPLFIDGAVAGVTSGGGWGGFNRTRSLYVDLHSSTSKAFLSNFIEY